MSSRGKGSQPGSAEKPASAQSQKAQYSAPPTAPPSEDGFTPLSSIPSSPEQRPSTNRTGQTRAQSLEDSSFDPQRQGWTADFDPKFGQDISIIRQYLRDTELELSFRSLCNLLLSRADIPCNPYPGFVKRIRQLSESFHMKRKSEVEIKKMFDYPFKNSDVSYVTYADQYDHIWGLPAIVRCVDPFVAHDYGPLVEDLTPKMSTLKTDEGYSNQVVSSLVGPAVFHGTFYDVPITVQVRIEYLITGQNEEKAIDLFISSVLSDVNYMMHFTAHTVLGVNVPVKHPYEEIWFYDFWSIEMIRSDEGEFWSKLREVVYDRKFINAEIIMKTDSYTNVYRRGQKQYGLNYVKFNKEESEKEIFSVYAEVPMMTLFEGYFFKRNVSEAYMSMFLPRKQLSGQNGPDVALDVAEPDRKYPGKNIDFGAKYRQKLGFTRAEKPDKVDIDGFRFQDEEDANSPYSWNITSPVRSLWQKKIATLHPQLEVFEAAHYILLLSMMDRESVDPDIFVELYGLFHSTAARLIRLLDKNKVIRELIINYQDEQESSLVNQLFYEYRRDLKELLDSPMHERSIDVITIARRVDTKLGVIVTKKDGSARESVPLETETVVDLRFINLYCTIIYDQFIEDALQECPLIAEFISGMKNTFPEYARAPETQEKYHKPDRMGGSSVGLQKKEVKYGLEYEPIVMQDRQVINVEMCIERDLAPKNIVTESVLMKYMIDVHLDEVWSEYLTELLARPVLPPNPYPAFVTHLRQAAFKMHLMFESNERVVKRLQHSTPKLTDPQNYIYEIPGSDAFGHISAMGILDTAAFFTLAQMTKKLINTDFTQRKGAFKIAITTAISGNSPLYGRMDPYLRLLELHEHCFVKGPNGCYGQGIQIYAKILVDHLYDILRDTEHAFHGFYLGDDDQRWTEDDIMTRKRGFTSEVERAISQKQSLILKFYMLVDWLYVPLVKKHHFTYVSSDETQRERFFDWSPVNLYQNIFFDKEKAAFHFQQGSTPDGQNPFSGPNLRIALNLLDQKIMKEAADFNWLRVHRFLLTRSMMKQSTTHMAETWRMLHSVAAQVEYVNSLNLSIQELVLYALDEEEEGRENPAANLKFSDDRKKTHIGSLELKAFGRMMEAFRAKVDTVLKTSTVMAPKLLPDIIDSKFKQICERDKATEELFVRITVKTVQTLEQVRNMMIGLQETLAYEIHMMCPEAQATIKSIQAEMNNRPVTYEWNEKRQSQPNYTHPKIRISATEDRVGEWTHR